MEMSKTENIEGADATEMPLIESFGGQDADNQDNRKKKVNEKQAQEEWYRLYKLLFQIDFFPPSAKPSDERLAQMEKTLRYLAEKHPKFKASSDRVELPTRHGSIHAQTHRIEFVKPSLKLFGRPKFTMEDAIAMARLAGQNEHMLAKGIRLRGTDDQQALLRAAIDQVNKELPAGMKLVIRDANEAPVPQPSPAKEPEKVPTHTNPNHPQPDGESKVQASPAKESPVKGTFDDEDTSAETSDMSLGKEASAGAEQADATSQPEQESSTVSAVAPEKPEGDDSGSTPQATSTDADIVAQAAKFAGDFDNFGQSEPSSQDAETSAVPVKAKAQKSKPTRKPKKKSTGSEAGEPDAAPVSAEADTAPNSAESHVAPVATEISKPVDADNNIVESAPDVRAEEIDSGRRSLLFLGRGAEGQNTDVPAADSVSSEQTQSADVSEDVQKSEPVSTKEPRKFTRRLLGLGVFALAVTMPTSAAAEGLLAKLGFKKSKTYDRQKAGAGLRNKTLASRPETAKEKKARKLQEAAAKKNGKKPLTEQDKKEIKKWNAAARRVEKDTKIARDKLKPKVKASEEALQANKERKKGLFALLFGGAAAKPVSNDNKPRPKKGDLTGLFTSKAKKGGVYLYHRHTGETYFLDFSKIETARCQTEMNRFLRDHYSGAVAKMDKRLSYYLRDVAVNLGADRIDIVSGYRTRNTNINVLKNSSAGRSQHCLARAMDIAVKGVSAKKIYRAAEKAGCDGIGLYADKNYVHVDCRGHAARW